MLFCGGYYIIVYAMYEVMCFVWVNFPNDPKVFDRKYWYLCPFDGASPGDRVIAPLGRHNRTQEGVICEVRITEDYNAPFPLYLIKTIRRLIKDGRSTYNKSFNAGVTAAMYKIVKKRILNPTVTMMDIEAPLVAAKGRAGQFIILRVDPDGERIPLTIAGCDRQGGTVKIIFQVVGATTMALNAKAEGEYISDFVGPLGRPTETEGIKKVCIVGGGVGCAIALPVAEQFHKLGAEVHSIVGFRNKDLVILEEEFSACSDRLTIMSDDGSYGRKGVVTMPLKEALESGERYDEVIAIGPVIMMKFVVETTCPYGVPTTVSMNPIMIDGTGMCGGCRLTVGGQTKFACVDGPDFNGFEVDFDEAMARSTMYADFERREREESCNLFAKEVE